MKAFGFFLSFLLFILLSFLLYRLWSAGKGLEKPNVLPPVDEPVEPTDSTLNDDISTIKFEGMTFAYSYFRVEDPSGMTLIANFTDRTLGSDLAKTDGCRKYVNGNFYDTDGNPLGLWRNGSVVRGTSIESKTFNGFFSVSIDGIPTIGFAEPVSPKLAIQTGPMLISDSEILPLRIAKDELARRMVAGIGKDTVSYFLSVYQPDATYGGPMLSQLPGVVQAISDIEGWSLTDAVNLDGGSASAFSNGTTTLQELSPIGSMICIPR